MGIAFLRIDAPRRHIDRLRPVVGSRTYVDALAVQPMLYINTGRHAESSEVRRALEASATGRNSGLSRGVRPDCLHRLQSLQSVCRCTAARHCTARRLARQRSRSGQAFALQGVQLRRSEDHNRAPAGRPQCLSQMSATVQLMRYTSKRYCPRHASSDEQYLSCEIPAALGPPSLSMSDDDEPQS